MSSSPEPSAEQSKESPVAKSATVKKGGLSCAECRRSKLRCSRTFPCDNCVKRGCSSICPNGTLTATKGNKVLQTQNQTLQDKVKSMQARMRDLETALSTTQAQLSSQPHPLLEESTVNRESEAILHVLEGGSANGVNAEELKDAFGSLSIGEQGQAKFHGQSAGSGFLQSLLPVGKEDPFRELGFSDAVCDKRNYGLPYHILELVSSFPFGKPTTSQEAKEDLLQFIPTHEQAVQLSHVYFDNIATTFRPIRMDDYATNILDKIFCRPPGTSIWENIHSHQLAVFFFVMAIGMIFENDAYAKAVAERYCALGRASLSLDSLAKDTTSYTVLALFVLTQYYGLADRATNECQWQIGGLMTRLAYQIGLQRDPSIWDLGPEETQRRRILFWELYTLDAWASIVYGRPPSLDIRYTDCRFPEDKEYVVGQNGEQEHGYHAWKYRFAAAGLSQVVQHVFGMKSHDYAALLELDRNLRKIQMPPSLQSPTSTDGEPMNGKAWSDCPPRALMQYSAICSKESVLLYIHRRFFARALRLNPKNPLETKYGASVMAAYRSCCLLLQGFQSLCMKHSQSARQKTFFFSSAFSACITLGCLAFNSPSCPLTGSALDVLDIGVALYRNNASNSTHCPLTAELIFGMQRKTRQMYNNYVDFVTGKTPVYKEPDHADPQCNFMRVLEGFTTVVNNQKSASGSPSPSQPNAPMALPHAPPPIPDDLPTMFDGIVAQANGHLPSDYNSDSSSSSPGHGRGGDFSSSSIHIPMQQDYTSTPAMFDAIYSQYPAGLAADFAAAELPNNIASHSQPIQLTQDFINPQSTHMTNGHYANGANGVNGANGYHPYNPQFQGAVDLSMNQQAPADDAAWTKFFRELGDQHN